MIFWTKFAQKKVFLVKDRKIQHHHWILRIWIGLGTKFQIKLTILIFWIKFATKRYFRSQAEKVNITIEFCIFELVYVPNFSLNWQFWVFVPNLPKEGVSSRKRKKLPSFRLFAKFQLKLTIWIFLDQICPKRAFPLWNRKSEYYHWFLHIWFSLGAKSKLKLTI